MFVKVNFTFQYCNIQKYFIKQTILTKKTPRFDCEVSGCLGNNFICKNALQDAHFQILMAQCRVQVYCFRLCKPIIQHEQSFRHL